MSEHESRIFPDLPPGYRWATPDEVEECLTGRRDYVQVRVGGTDEDPHTDLAVEMFDADDTLAVYVSHDTKSGDDMVAIEYDDRLITLLNPDEAEALALRVSDCAARAVGMPVGIPCCTYYAIDERDLAEHRRLNHEGT